MGKTVWILGVIISVILAATAGFAAMGPGDHGARPFGGFFDHLHELGRHLHHGESQDRMADLFDEMQLSDAQRAHLTKIHEAVETAGSHPQMNMEALHQQLMGQFMEGDVDANLITDMIDRQLDEMRQTAYTVTHELVGLVNGLDEGQREILKEHLHELHGRADGHGH